jgi:hypothetical protein
MHSRFDAALVVAFERLSYVFERCSALLKGLALKVKRIALPTDTAFNICTFWSGEAKNLHAYSPSIDRG